ncbi:MAG TPA: glycoside hydrolase, partial [Campylobacterales bacterium]|nr:glycoside hydrolase [Campylobacterales bacterium]
MESRSLNLGFFWHMHQPDYRDSQGVMMMPWVFLHAIKDYYEMPWLLSQHSGLKATFNITAPLIEQINLYRDPLKHDHFLSLWAKHPSELSSEEKAWFLKICKSTQYETMIKPIAELERLYHLEVMRDAELIDFQVLFLLTWCGNYLRQNDPLIQSLFAQGKGFASSDKAKLLQNLCDFTQEILPFYAQLQAQGVISLATTPYNHPILPLLLDMENAKEANPHTALPDNPMPLREDAIAQVERSIALYQETFGREPTGFWPAEGAVDEASIAIYQERGIRWIATDEAILFRSLGSDNRAQLYRPYRFDGMTIGFRDHGLSDLIGFNYRFKSGEEASRHFMQTVEPIAREQEEATLFIILDGENAWEFFEDNAYDFFTTLYATLSQTPWCKSVTMDEVAGLERYGRLSRVAPGSWIHGNFDTWSGHSEKNRAWELIFQTRRDVENY